MQLAVRFGVDTAGTHETQCPIDLAGQLVVLLALGAAGHELLGPRVHPVQVGEAAFHESANEVQCGGALVVRLHQTSRVGATCLGRWVLGVHDVTTEAGQVYVADALEW